MTNKKINKDQEASRERPEREATAASGSARVDRRKLLGAMVASGAISGAALPEKWRKPVVNSVILPAHAQTTGPGPSAGCNASILTAILSGTTLNVVAQGNINALCVQGAHSLFPTGGNGGFTCALISGGTTLHTDTSPGVDDCSSSITQALVSGCMVSCSVSVTSADQAGIMDGSSITMRFSFGGTCVCSAVGTVNEVE